MDWRGGLRTAQGIMWYGIGAVLGWPFAGALVIPFVCEELILGSVTQSGLETARRLVDGFTRSLIVLAAQFFIDLFFYHRIVVVPWNIVRYNLFSSKGPELYGTEPWDFYLRNFFLNFNLWTFLALLSMPLLLWQNFIRRLPATRQSFLRNATFLSPFYLWLLIFSAQPHKEERFMYPVYPLLALNAAIALHIIMIYLGSSNPRDLVTKLPSRARMAAIVLFVILTLDIAFLRTYGLISGYRAPLQIYTPLKSPGVARPGDNVCLGKEWYRFPSSYHLPNGARAKFIKSEFDGLLPGEFSEAKVGFGFFPGAWLEPPGMNDENREDLGKYVSTRSPAPLYPLR
jgi:alpha-1,2-mannosyltransferase